jgi:hypothetical protein
MGTMSYIIIFRYTLSSGNEAVRKDAKSQTVQAAQKEYCIQTGQAVKKNTVFKLTPR